jgi:hypothetical protein
MHPGTNQTTALPTGGRTQVLAACYALAQLLRLQLLWAPRGIVMDGGFYPATLCRTYTAVLYGLLEPAFLLLALFACVYR